MCGCLLHRSAAPASSVFGCFWRAASPGPAVQRPERAFPHEPMLERIWELRENTTAYDAAYLALAEALGARLLTFDARLTRAPGHRARIELLTT